MDTRVAIAALLLAGQAVASACGNNADTADRADATADGGRGDNGDAATDALAADTATHEGDVGDAGPFVPTSARAELIDTSPGPVLTPPAWNAHSPKLAGDRSFLYAVHTYFTDPVATRYAAILRRPAAPAVGAGQWTEVARIVYPHQPPGIVMDTSLQLHLVFDCLRPGTADVTCFQGGAGTTGLGSRFYHLVFGARDATGALLLDTYANTNEWTGESNGYTGIGTTADGVTWWSLADTSWGRVVQWSEGSMGGTIATLTAPSADLLYPIHAAHPTLGSKQLVVYAGNFDPDGGNNASYTASTAYAGNLQGLALLFTQAPAMPPPGTIAAFPSDLAFDASGTLYALSYLPGEGGLCTQLLRFDGGLTAAPTILPVGCVSDYATLHFSRAGTLYLMADASTGASTVVGISPDRGTSWRWVTIPITGLPANGDVQYHGFTPIKAYTSPTIFDPDKLTFFFYGADASGNVENSYLGEIDLGG